MSDKSVVKSQMPGGKVPGLKGVPGVYDHCDPPFDKPHDLGNGGIPVKMYEDHGAKAADAKITATKNAALSYGGSKSQGNGGSSRPVQRAAPPTNKK